MFKGLLADCDTARGLTKAADPKANPMWLCAVMLMLTLYANGVIFMGDRISAPLTQQSFLPVLISRIFLRRQRLSAAGPTRRCDAAIRTESCRCKLPCSMHLLLLVLLGDPHDGNLHNLCNKENPLSSVNHRSLRLNAPKARITADPEMLL